MSFRTSPWSNRPKSGWFVITKNDKMPLGTEILDADNDKSSILAKCQLLNSQGIACWIENLEGKKFNQNGELYVD